MDRSIIYPCDCIDAMRALMDENSVDSVITDPPYDLTSTTKRFGSSSAAPAQFGTDGAFQRAARGFMGKTWDGTGVAFRPETWREVYRVLKPGGYLIAFGGTRTYHRMACAIEDAGFEIRDMIEWIYGQGFPKSHDAGEGRGTALKPAHEPICVARKPLIGSVDRNLAVWGTGAINIDGCRIEGIKPDTTRGAGGQHGRFSELPAQGRILDDGKGRFPANVIHDGSDEVIAGFPVTKSNSGNLTHKRGIQHAVSGKYGACATSGISDEGSAARFFYCAKASKADRDEGLDHLPRQTADQLTGRKIGSAGLVMIDGKANPFAGTTGVEPRANGHPTVKPTDLMRYLTRMHTPPGGIVFDPFTGSGSTGKAAMLEGMQFVGCEMTPEYVPIAEARIRHALIKRLALEAAT